MKQLYQSGEDYLETILLLQERGGPVRAVDVADAMGFSRPSVSRAMGILREAGLVRTDECGCLLLTPAGEQRARAVYERHRLITRFLVRTLGVDEALAAHDACRIEHVISEETFCRIRSFVEGDFPTF